MARNSVKTGQWHSTYTACETCGGTDSPYRCKGQCARCYFRAAKRRKYGVPVDAPVSDGVRMGQALKMIGRVYPRAFRDPLSSEARARLEMRENLACKEASC